MEEGFYVQHERQDLEYDERVRGAARSMRAAPLAHDRGQVHLLARRLDFSELF